jgi:protein-tyrosine phosphatase
MVHSRHIALEGASNMRDLGGLPLGDGGWVRRGRLYRSAALNELTEGDRVLLSGLGLSAVVDLRSEAERTYAPSRLPPGLPVIAPGDGGVGSIPGYKRRPNPVTEADARRMMRAGMGALYRTLAETEGGVLFHCAAGKDRTGFAAAIILLATGASHETVVEDYLATNIIWDRKSARLSGLPRQAREAVFSARAEYLEAALEAMVKEFGQAEDYLTGRCGVSAGLLEQVTRSLWEHQPPPGK